MCHHCAASHALFWNVYVVYGIVTVPSCFGLTSQDSLILGSLPSCARCAQVGGGGCISTIRCTMPCDIQTVLDMRRLSVIRDVTGDTVQIVKHGVLVCNARVALSRSLITIE